MNSSLSDSVAATLGNRSWPKLTSLLLRNSDIGDRGVKSWITKAHMPLLKSLALGTSLVR